MKIKLFSVDVDGVLTDGGMYYSEKGEVMKKFNTRDGMGFEILRKNGIIPVIISKENSEIVMRRAEKLKVKEVHIGINNKVKEMKQILQKYNIDFEHVAHIGDDINDLPLIKRVGLSFAPMDAMQDVKINVDYVTQKKGGEGAFRDAVEIIMNNYLKINPTII